MKLKKTFKTLLMIIATVMSVVSGILIDSGTLAYAATTYTLTLNWDDGVEWVATDKDGIYRWEKGGSKTFQAGSKAYTYVKLKNGATVKSFFSRQENKDWTDYTYTSGSLCYDTWTMYNNRNVDIYTSVSSSADVSYDWDNLVTSSKHYHSSNGNEASWSNLRDDLGRSPAPIYSIYYKLQENRYRETCYGDNQEDKDFGGYEIMLRTEDSHNSYWYGQSSYANGDRFDDWYRDEFEGIKLSNLAIVPVQIKGDKFLQINISIKNTNSYAKEISLATCSDIQVADDDNATTFFNGNGFTMTNMYCETSTAQLGTIPTTTLNVYAKDVPGYVTDADAVYIGHFVYRKQHIWSNNVLGDKTTYFNKKPHGGTSGEGESDSGFSIAWKNRTIAAGQTQTYSYIIGIGKYNSDNKITFDANGGELKTPGTSINNPSGNYSNKVTVTYGTDTYSSMSNDIPERAGYTFEGWWTTPNDSNASVMVYDASGKCNNDCNYWKNNQWQGTNDLTVYAHWKANTYTVRLNTGDIPLSELTELTETASTEGWTWNENGRYFSKAFIQNENNYLPGVNKFFSANNYESVGSKVTDKYFVQDKTKNPTKVLYNWWTSASGGTDIGRGKKTYNNLYEISKDNSGIVNLYPHWMGYTTVFNYTDTAPSNTAGQTVTINNNINDGMDNNLYQVYGNCFFYKGTDGEYHDYKGTNPDLRVTASIPDSNGYKYIFNGWHHKNWNYLTDGLGKLTYKNNYNIGQGKTSYSLSPHFSRVGINYNVRLNANVPDTESTLQVLHQNGISSYIYNSTSRYFSRELTYDDSQDMLSPDVYSLKGYHLISRSNWYTEKTGGNTVSAPCNNTKTEYPDWTEKNWNLTTTDGATVDLYARWQANNYKIAYNLNGGTYGTSHPTSADYDTMVTIDNPSKAGYTFTGWAITGYDSTTSGHNAATWTGETGTSYKNLTATDGATVTFTAQWTAKTDTPYKVEHYKMNLDGTTYTLADTDNFKGTTDASVTPAIKTYEGFTSPSTQTVTIKGDGTTVVKYYYIRNKYTLDLNGFISSVSRPNLTEEVDGQIFIAGKATVTVNGKVLATNETDFCQMVYYGSSYKITTVPEAGYSIVGNTTVEGTMPASDKTVTITINANKDTKYIVRHWKEKLYLDGTKTYADSSKHNTTNYFLADTDNLTGQTNRLVTPAVKTYEGFTSPSAITVRVKGDGSLIVDYYYTRNTYTLKTDDSDSNKDDQDNGIKSGNGIDSSKTNVISEGNNKKDNKKKFKYEEVVTVTTDTLSGYHWHINDDCETIKRNLYPTGWSDHEGYRVEKWYTENGKTYGYKDQTTKFYMPAHDVKLDVNATNNSYKIIFEKNKPMNVTNPYTGAVSSASNEITGTVTDTFYIYNHANQKLPGNVYNLTGWTFKGWSLKKDYSNGYGFGWEYGTNSWNNDLSHLTTKNLDVIHMYAKWEANRYQITFNYEHNSSNPYGNLGYDEKAEAATKLTKNGADSKTATYDAKVGSLPNPTLTGATFVKWVDSKGNEYTEDTIYKITSPITLYAVWQQNTGTFAYIANGITYNNNGIGVYEATNSDGTNQFKAMTEDITLEENKFGTTMENTSYSNFTKKSKYGYVVINAGTSYAKETDTSGDSVYYSFQGWSANNYATVAGDKNAGLIHQIGYKDRLFNYAYETMANEMNTLGTGYNSKDTSVADSIRAKANELYNTKELTQNNTYAIMYAVWDQFPVIKSDQVVLTINDFSAYINENANGFEQHAYDVIKDRIINANTVKDREDGNIRDNIEIENLDEILNMMLTMYKTPGMTSSMVTIRTHVSDSVGNTTYGYTTVALINNKAKQDDPIIPTVDEDGKEINTRILSAKVRSITREFYNTGYEGSSDYKSDYSAATYKNYGGLIPNSIWYKNEEYVKTINQCFDNFDNNTPEQTWYFTHDDVLSIQEYAKQHKDTPHGVEDGELTNFYNKYKSCIIQGIDAS